MIYWDIFSPVNASLSAKSTFWEELCSCAVSTGSNKETEIYVSVFCLICYVTINFNLKKLKIKTKLEQSAKV